MPATRFLYLARHGEATSDQSGLTTGGRRQAELLGERLSARPITKIHHSPLARAAETAAIIAGQLDRATIAQSAIAGDYVPYWPTREELPPDSADRMLNFLAQFPDEDRELGSSLAQRALDSFTGPVRGTRERHELVVTHNFLIGWLLGAAMDSPPWRWLSVNHGNAALTVIRYSPGRPSSVLVYNDTRHLPDDLRWTGLPAELKV